MQGVCGGSVLSVVPEGTKVAKGQVIAEVEQVPLHEQLRKQRLAVAQAKADWEKTKFALRSRELQSERELLAAALELKLLQLDRQRYLEAESGDTRESLRQAADLARQRSQQAQTQAKWSQELADQGYLTRELLERDRAGAAQAEANLKLAQDRVESFNKLSHRLREMVLNRRIRFAKTALEQRKQSAARIHNRFDTQQSEADRRFRTAELNFEALREQLSTRAIRAPRDGVVVYTDELVLHRKVAFTGSPHATIGWPSGGEEVNPTVPSFRAPESLQQSRQQLAVLKDENTAHLAEAEQKIMLARLALEEYTQGTYPQRQSALRGEINNLREDLKRAQRRLEWSQRVIKKGYITKTALEADRLSVAEWREKLKNAERRLEVLNAFTFKRRTVELRGTLQHAERELRHRQEEAKLRLASARSQGELARLSDESLGHESELEDRAIARASSAGHSEAETPEGSAWIPLVVVDNASSSGSPEGEAPRFSSNSLPGNGPLRVPIDAVVRQGNDSFCFVRTPQGIRKRKVVPGKSDEKFVEVKQGVEQGALVLTNPRKMVPDAVFGE